jgi:hypothetical protein
MEYVAFHRSYHDIPVDIIVAVWEESYGKERVKKWIEDFEKAKGKPIADFQSEDILDQ